MRILPAMFALVEMCVEALAVDTACAEDAGDGSDNEDAASLPVLSERCAAEQATCTPGQQPSVIPASLMILLSMIGRKLRAAALFCRLYCLCAWLRDFGAQYGCKCAVG